MTARAALLLTTVAGILGCSGLLGPPAEIQSLRGGPCGTIEGTMVRQGYGSEPIAVEIDGISAPPVALGEGPEPFTLLAAPGSRDLTMSDLHHLVEVPPFDLSLRPRPAAVLPREGRGADVTVDLVGACPREGLRVELSLPELDRAVQPVDAAAGPLVIPLGPLPAGVHRVRGRLTRDGALMSEREWTITVAPPCLEARCADEDGDGHAHPSAGGADCDDQNPAIYPGALLTYPDPDGDGAVFLDGPVDLDCDGLLDTPSGPFDCDEGDPAVPRPEDPEPNGRDDDCDGVIDEGTVAYDDDGDGATELAGDCDDADVQVAPGLPELPDCKDNDCDDAVDEGAPRPPVDDAHEPGPLRLAGAKPRSGIFGGFEPTDDAVRFVVRDSGDAESLALVAHDGHGDAFHVSLHVRSAGRGLRYAVTIVGPRGEVRDVVGSGGTVRYGGTAFDDDSGEYSLLVEPVGESPPYCPLDLQIESG
jgi:hypothetical protein